MLYIFNRDNDLWNYMLEDISQHYSVTKVKLSRNTFIRILRKVLGSYIVYFPFLRKKIIVPNVQKTLKKIKSGDSILLLGVLLPSEIRIIAGILPVDCNMYFWYWNPLNREYLEKRIQYNISFIKSLGYQIYTFDPKDASRYKIHFHNQFGRMLPVNNNYELKYDCYFLGKRKKRENLCNKIENILHQMGFKNLFIHVSSSNDIIPYAENIKYVFQSKCIIDIVQPGQTGLTLRPLEALFYKKKLITTNIEIQNYDFYKQENIFIWGKDSISDLPAFLASPYKEVSNNIVLRYTINEWVKKFDT